MYTKEHNKTNKYLMPKSDLFCRYCGKQCKNLNSLTQHEIRCKYNQNRIITVMSNQEWREKYTTHRTPHAPWNKGLTKETDARVANSAKKSGQALKGKCSGRGKTEKTESERRRKISFTMKNNPNAGGLRHGSGRGHKGWYKGFFCDSTYELVYVIYNIDHGIAFKRCHKGYEYYYDGIRHLYHPDFELPDGSLIEIKGYISDLTKAKITSVKDRKLTVLTQNDLQYAFQYVAEAYSFEKIEDLYEQKQEKS